jgi:predicted permease
VPSLREWFARLWNTFGAGRRDADLESELRLHMEMAAEAELRRRGSGRVANRVERNDARRSAAITAGGMTQAMEELRDQRGLPWLAGLARDLRHGVRVLGRNPLFASVSIATLALGIGANTAIFSIADAVLLRTLPVVDPHDLVVLRQRTPAGASIFPFTSSAATALDEERSALSGVAAFRPAAGIHAAVNGEAELVLTQAVSGNYHAVLGVRAVAGRTLTWQDREPLAVISHRYWQRRFAGDPNVIGRVIELQGRAFTIVGVTPAEFFGTQPGRYVDVTTPLGAQATAMPPDARWLYLIGRLAPGVVREQAQAALRLRWARLMAASPAARRAVTLELDPGAQGLNELRRQFSLPLRMLMAAVGVVLLVACANLAGLMIVRSSARQHEIAIRLSIGAARRHIVRQFLAESALLAAAGGIAAVAVARWLADVLLALMSRGRGLIAVDVALNARTLAFAAAATIAAAVLFGLLPALSASRTSLQTRLKASTGGDAARANLWARALVSAQVALLVLLLASAGLFTRTLQKLRAVDAGFRQDQVLVVGVSTGPAYPDVRKRALYDELLTRFGGLPGVQSVSMSMDSPGGELSMGAGMAVPGRPPDGDDSPTVFHNFVGPRFFETMGIPVLSGRDFSLSDDAGAPKHVVIDEAVARRYFGDDDPIGRQIIAGDPRCGRCPPAATATIVGVVKNVRYSSLRLDAPLMVYRPYRQQSSAPVDTFLIRASSGDVATLGPLLQAEVRAAAPALPRPSVVSLDDTVAGVLVEERMLAALSTAIGGLAAMLAAIGIYSIVAATVRRRQRELGIRMALGARPGRVAGMVVGEALAIVGTGLAIGVPAAIMTALAARSQLAGVLFELSPTDPLIFSSAAAAILLIAAFAAYIPARRAGRIDPLAVVKCE